MFDSFPVRKSQVEAEEASFVFHGDPSVTHVNEPPSHEGPVTSDRFLPPADYRCGIHKKIADERILTCAYTRLMTKYTAFFGDYTEVFCYCEESAIVVSMRNPPVVDDLIFRNARTRADWPC
jgi:hypothetical protein